MLRSARFASSQNGALTDVVRATTAILVAAGVLVGPFALAATAASRPHASYQVMGSYVSVTPFRITDTRPGSGQPNAGGTLGPNTTLDVQVTRVGLQPIPAGSAAVVLNVTAVDPTASGFLTVFPAGSALPAVSNLNFSPGLTVANLVTVPLSSSGMIALYNHAGETNVVVDVEGYYISSPLSNSSGLYNPVSPVRALGTIYSGSAVGPNSNQTVTVTGTLTGVPANASAVVVNATASGGTRASFLTVYPDGQNMPTASNLNFAAGQVIANRVSVGVGSDGRIEVYNHAGTVNVDIDVDGYYSGAGGSGTVFVPISPVRLTDTRVSENGSPLAADTSAMFNLAPASSGIPTTAVAVASNITVVPGRAAGYLAVYPTSDLSVPVASDINWSANDSLAVPNFTIADTAGTGNIDVYASHGTTVNLLIDAFGYFVRQLPTSTTVSQSSSSVTFGHESATIFYVEVTTRYGEAVPNGESVSVHVGSATCTAQLKANKGSCALSNTAVGAGSYTVSAYYGGDDELAGSSGSGTSKLTVYKDSTSTAVSQSPTSVTYGHESATTFSIAVSTHYGEGVPDGESVVVHVGSASCTAGLKDDKGTCTLSNTALGTGSYSVSASYGGDGNLDSSSGSGTAKLTVNKDTTSTAVSESPTSVTYGKESAALFSVSVTSHEGESVPDGETVTVHVGSTSCTAELKGNKTSCTIGDTALSAGSYPVSVSYGGDANLDSSSGSGATNLTVGKDTTSTAVSESPTSVTYGQESDAVFSISVTSHYGEAVPDGESAVVHVGSASCTAQLKGEKGSCTLPDSALATGSYPVSASYGGDANLDDSSGSSSSNLTV